MAIKLGDSIVTKDLVLYLNASAQQNYVLSEVEVLVVAGGGGGSGNFYDDGAGGGAGGLIYSASYSVTSGSAISVTVGLGGDRSTGGAGSNGQNSVFGNLIAIGGGGGAGHRSAAPSGGSGGGGGGSFLNDGLIVSGGSATQPSSASGGFGNPGGNGGINNSVQGGGYPGSGGGGGAGAPGGWPLGGGIFQGGAGGNGLPFSISGTATFYAGGGGGVRDGIGGLGGGGRASFGRGGSPAENGVANTGGGGGGGRASAGETGIPGNGGSGVVIVRYPGPQKATGGTITSVGGYTIHTFNSSGTFTPLSAPANSGSVYGLQNLSVDSITLTQSGGVTYSTSNRGSFIFDGVDDLLISTPTPLLLQGNPDITVIGFYRRIGNFAGRGFWGIGGSNAGGTGQGINNWNNANTNEIAIDSWGQSTFTTGQTYPLNTWIGVAWRKIAGPMTRANCIVSIFNGTTLTHYTSTSLTVLRAEAGSNLVINSIGGLTIGSISVDTVYCSPVNIGSHSIYNRVLTDVEIQQNFNAQRGRFGL